VTALACVLGMVVETTLLIAFLLAELDELPDLQLYHVTPGSESDPSSRPTSPPS
jgi:hypothetical protein